MHLTEKLVPPYRISGFHFSWSANFHIRLLSRLLCTDIVHNIKYGDGSNIKIKKADYQ